MSFYFSTRRVFATRSLFNYRDTSNPQVFIDVSNGDKHIGRIVFELYKNHCPKTAENFRAFITGDNKLNLSYKGNHFHRIIKGFMAQGGDITKGDGTGSVSIYGSTFRDENLKLKHYKRGLLSMANAGPDSNGSQFFITFTQTPWLDGYHCVFGEVIDGDIVLNELERHGSEDGHVKHKLTISDCGELQIKH